MKTIRAIIIDDEPLAHKVILKYAEDIPFLDIVGEAFQATAAYSLLEQEAIDLIFLDIEMPKLRGLDFLRTLAQKPAVIVTSAYEEFALEGFELQIDDYLLKPFRFARFLQAVQKVYTAKQGSTTPIPDFLYLKVDKKQVRLQLSDIVCLESYGNYVKVWAAQHYHLTARTLASFKRELPDEQFVQVHKSFIVHRQLIDYIEGGSIVMKSGQRIPVGKNFRKLLKGGL